MDNRVFLAKCEKYEHAAAAVERVLDAFGGASAILNGRKRVLVKPNIIMPRKPEDAATTHPAVVEAVCAAFVKAGADVEITDSTASPHKKIILRMLYGKTGIKTAAENSGAKLCYNVKSRTVPIPEGRVLEKADLLSTVLDAELVISVAKAKTHVYMAMTGCVKNMMGAVKGLAKPILHRKFPNREDFAAMLVDICRHVSPGFSILDGVYGMEGAGPSGGDPKYLGIIAGGFSPYAVDLAQSYLMGLRADSIYTINEAAARELAPHNKEELAWLGDDHEQFRTVFVPAVKYKNDAVPAIMNNCTGCGDCARICPIKCISIQKKIAIINEKECIRCYCCHEFCPAKAVLLE